MNNPEVNPVNKISNLVKQSIEDLVIKYRCLLNVSLILNMFVFILRKDVNKLTPLSLEVMSRQATINVGKSQTLAIIKES